MSRLSCYAPYSANYCHVAGRRVRIAVAESPNSQLWYDLAGEMLRELKAKLPAAEFDALLDGITTETNREVAERCAKLLSWDVTVIY